MRTPGVAVSVVTAPAARGALRRRLRLDGPRGARRRGGWGALALARAGAAAARRRLAARARCWRRSVDGALRRLVDRAGPLLGRAEPDARLRRLPRARAPARRRGRERGVPVGCGGCSSSRSVRPSSGRSRGRRSPRSSPTAAAPPACATRSATGTRSRWRRTCCSCSRSGWPRRPARRAPSGPAARSLAYAAVVAVLLSASRAGVAAAVVGVALWLWLRSRTGRGGVARARRLRARGRGSRPGPSAAPRSSRTGSRAPTGWPTARWFGLAAPRRGAQSSRSSSLALDAASARPRLRGAGSAGCSSASRRWPPSCRRDRGRGRRGRRGARSSRAGKWRTTRAASAASASNNRLDWWGEALDDLRREAARAAPARTRSRSRASATARTLRRSRSRTASRCSSSPAPGSSGSALFAALVAAAAAAAAAALRRLRGDRAGRRGRARGRAGALAPARARRLRLGLRRGDGSDALRGRRARRCRHGRARRERAPLAAAAVVAAGRSRQGVSVATPWLAERELRQVTAELDRGDLAGGRGRRRASA